MNSSVVLKYPRQRFEALAHLHSNLLQAYEPENDHEKLLFEHLIEIETMFRDKLRKEQEKYSIRLSAPQALAFYQLWQQCNFYADPYSKVILGDAIKNIDKVAKAPKRIRSHY